MPAEEHVQKHEKGSITRGAPLHPKDKHWRIFVSVCLMLIFALGVVDGLLAHVDTLGNRDFGRDSRAVTCDAIHRAFPDFRLPQCESVKETK